MTAGMAKGTSTVAKPGAFWGVIRAAVEQRATTKDLWDSIKADAARRNLVVPPSMWSGVNVMRSQAATLRGSITRLSKARDDQAITSRMIGTLPYKRQGQGADAVALYHVRFELTTNKQGVEGTDWRVVSYPGALPATVGELREEIGLFASDLANAYSQEFVGVGDIEIGEY